MSVGLGTASEVLGFLGGSFARGLTCFRFFESAADIVKVVVVSA